MSDQSQGPGWWQASDGKWYPPEQSPTPAAGGGTPGASVEVGAALTYGWNKFVQYIGQIIVIVLIILGVNIVFQILSNALAGGIGGTTGLLMSLLLTIVGVFISFLLAAGVIRAALAITRGETPEPAMLFQTDNLTPYIIGSLLVSIAIFIGFFVLCIGALLVMFFTYFYGFYIIDRGVDGVTGIKESFNLVKDNAGTVLVFVIVATVLNLITCGLAFGITYIAGAYVYKTLNGEAVAA